MNKKILVLVFLKILCLLSLLYYDPMKFYREAYIKEEQAQLIKDLNITTEYYQNNKVSTNGKGVTIGEISFDPSIKQEHIESQIYAMNYVSDVKFSYEKELNKLWGQRIAIYWMKSNLRFSIVPSIYEYIILGAITLLSFISIKKDLIKLRAKKDNKLSLK